MQGDEISQAVQIELEGIRFFLKGSMQVVAWLSQALSALFDVAKDKIDHKGGERSLQQIFKQSQPDMPQTILIDEKFKEEFLQYVREKGLQYCKAIDFDLTDGKTPILVPANQMSAYAVILDAFQKRRINEEEAALKKAQNEIGELKEKLLTADKKEVPLLETTLENKIQATDELAAIHKESVDAYEEKGYVMSLEHYLSTAKDTEFERDPDKAIAEYNRGVPMVRNYQVEACMQPVRSPFLIPASRIQYYIPENGVSIQRSYHEENGMVYSNYSLKTNLGEIHEFSDKGVTEEKWNLDILPKLFDVAGMVEGMKCKVFESAEQAKAYLKHFNKTVPLSEEKKAVFTNAEAMTEAELAIEDALKGMASAKVEQDQIEFIVPQEKIFLQEGKLIYAPEGIDGVLYKFEKIQPGKIMNGMIAFSTQKDEQVIIRDGNNIEKSMSAEAMKKFVMDSRNKAADNIRNNINAQGK